MTPAVVIQTTGEISTLDYFDLGTLLDAVGGDTEKVPGFWSYDGRARHLFSEFGQQLESLAA